MHTLFIFSKHPHTPPPLTPLSLTLVMEEECDSERRTDAYHNCDYAVLHMPTPLDNVQIDGDTLSFHDDDSLRDRSHSNSTASSDFGNLDSMVTDYDSHDMDCTPQASPRTSESGDNSGEGCQMPLLQRRATTLPSNPLPFPSCNLACTLQRVCTFHARAWHPHLLPRIVHLCLSAPHSAERSPHSHLCTTPRHAGAQGLELSLSLLDPQFEQFPTCTRSACGDDTAFFSGCHESEGEHVIPPCFPSPLTGRNPVEPFCEVNSGASSKMIVLRSAMMQDHSGPPEAPHACLAASFVW
jgi:hypothetical protein